MNWNHCWGSGWVREKQDLQTVTSLPLVLVLLSSSMIVMAQQCSLQSCAHTSSFWNLGMYILVTFQLLSRPFRDGAYPIGSPWTQFNYISPYKQRPFSGWKCKMQWKGWPKAFNLWRLKQLADSAEIQGSSEKPQGLRTALAEGPQF